MNHHHHATSPHTQELQQQQQPAIKHFEPPPTTITRRRTKADQTRLPTTIIKTAKAYPGGVIHKAITPAPVVQVQQVPFHPNHPSTVKGLLYATNSTIIPSNFGTNEQELRNVPTTSGDNHQSNTRSTQSHHHHPSHTIPIREDGEINQEECNDTKKKKRSRKSFTIQEKIAHVTEYYKFCQSQREELKLQQQKQQPSAVDDDSCNDNQRTNKRKDRKKDEESRRIEEEQNKIINQDSSANMAAWLRLKYAKDETTIARSTFFRWYQTYGKQVKEANEDNNSGKGGDDFMECRHRKRIRTRPFHGEYLVIYY